MKLWSIQNYTTYSINSGVMNPGDWAKQAAELGYKTLGVSDKQTLGGLLQFQKACQKNDIKPVLGGEFAITPDLDIREKDKKENVEGVLLLYAKNEEGLKHLIQLNNVSVNRDDGGAFYFMPRLDIDAIRERAEGLICVVPVEDGWGRKTKPNTTELDELHKIVELNEIFGEDLYLGINPLSENRPARLKNKSITRSSALDSIKKVFTFNAHYHQEGYDHLYDVVRGMDGGRIKDNLPRRVSQGFLPTLEEVKESISQKHNYIEEGVLQECLENLDEVAEKCNAEIETGKYMMPKAELQTGSLKGDILKFIGEGFLKKICPTLNLSSNLASILQLEELLSEQDLLDERPHEHVAKEEDPSTLLPLTEYVERLKHEVKIIEELGYLDYFHIIRDVCRHVDEVGLGRGYARGSAAGSLVSYLLDITRVDPLRHGLIFERFLNPDRNDLPDIDLDFSVEARDEVKRYCRERWGEEHVLSIGTYGRLKVVSAIKNIARSNGYAVPSVDAKGNTTHVQYSYARLNDILSNTHAKATSRGREELVERLDENDKFQQFYQKHEYWIENVVMPLMETITGTGVHAAGTLITREPWFDCIPVNYHATKGVVTQWKDRDCEAAGHPKFDFLTVDGVSIVDRAKQLIKARQGVEYPPLEEIPLNDSKTLELFTKVKTKGIFQFNTWSQRKYLRQLKPTTFDELVAAVALVRPGPMAVDAHIDFADIKHGRKKAEYDHADLRPILGETHGLIVYQEQIMKIVQAIGGLTPSEADYVRKACGKKKIDEMRKWHSVFVEGGLKNGYDKELLDKLWGKIVEFAEYGFNKSHAVAYTLLSYVQAFIKVREPLEAWCAVLKYSSDDDSRDNSAMKMKYLLKENDIEIVYPNIFGYAPDFEPVPGRNAIFWPLQRIKGIGPSVVEELCKEDRRSFDSLEEMIETVETRRVHKGVVSKLIQSGFFDPLGEPWEVAEQYFGIRDENGRRDDGIPFDLAHRNSFRWYTVRNERYGMIIKPWKEVAPFHKNVETYTGDAMVKNKKKGEKVFIGGYVEKIYYRKTKYGNWYASLTLVDAGEEHEVRMWPGFFESRRLFEPDDNGQIHRPWRGQLIEVTGVVDFWNGRAQVSMGSSGCYCRVVWDPIDFIELKES